MQAAESSDSTATNCSAEIKSQSDVQSQSKVMTHSEARKEETSFKDENKEFNANLINVVRSYCTFFTNNTPFVFGFLFAFSQTQAPFRFLRVRILVKKIRHRLHTLKKMEGPFFHYLIRLSFVKNKKKN